MRLISAARTPTSFAVSPPGRGYGRDFLDDRASLRQRQSEEPGRGLQQIERTGALVQIDVGRQDPRLEIRRYRIEVVGGRE